MSTVVHEFRLKNKFMGSDSFRVRVSRKQKLWVARNFAVLVAATVVLVAVGSNPWVNEFFMPVVVESKTLGEWFFSLTTSVLAITAAAGLRSDITAVVTQNRLEENRQRVDFEYEVSQVVKSEFPEVNFPSYAFASMTVLGEGCYSTYADVTAADYHFRLKKHVVEVTVTARYENPSVSLAKK